MAIKARVFRSEHGTVGISFPEPSLAVQAAKDECDINTIIKRYMRTGELPEQRHGVYADISELTDLQDALEIVKAGEELFMELPAEVRKRFDNDPVKLVAFANDPRNSAEAVELGLAPRQMAVSEAEAASPRQPDPAPVVQGSTNPTK